MSREFDELAAMTVVLAFPSKSDNAPSVQVVKSGDNFVVDLYVPSGLGKLPILLVPSTVE